MERELTQARQTAAEYQALQVRWTQDVPVLEGIRTELAAAWADLVQGRERREHAEAGTLRAMVRLSTLEQLCWRSCVRRAPTVNTQGQSQPARRRRSMVSNKIHIAAIARNSTQ